ncbi:MAG: HAD family hydrolase [Lachnospiraceae bacterium]|jgi:HAD superfamily hydrolase (TIGR01549 family)|nr:HAD family hydrolase [Lachnospiraceae bacterium]
MLEAILFDLDGTLLPMDMEGFIKAYFGAIAQKMAPLGIDTKKLLDTIWKGTDAMVANDGSCLNEARFWQVYEEQMGTEALQYQSVFDEFYQTDFDKARAATSQNPQIRELIDWLQAEEIPMVVATNPVFPKAAQHKRISWAGLRPEEFCYITSYENSHYCKPNPAYYQEILTQLGLKAEHTLMVGNDVTEDMAAAELGMRVFLLTDCLWNPHKKVIDSYPHGGVAELKHYITEQLR